MIYASGLCISIILNEDYVPYVIPVDVFFNKVKTQEDITLYAI